MQFSSIASRGPILDSELFSVDCAAQRILINVFFDCAFNSSLIFHRPTFERRLIDGDVALHILGAIYAMATM